MLEILNFMKDRMVTREDVEEIVEERVEKAKNEIIGVVNNKIGGIENRLDHETFARKDLEQRIRTVLPSLPPEFVAEVQG